MLILTRLRNRVHHLFVISYSGWTRSNRSKLRNTLSAKQGGLRKGGSECCKRKKMEEKHKKDKEEIQKRFADVERRQAEEREADRERKRERARCAKEAGPEAIRKGKYPRCTQ